MDDNINEVTVVEQDLLMTVDDFAKQEDVTPRTVYRWIELGRLDTVERLGKKYVNASVPLKSGFNDTDNVRNDMKSKNAGALQNVNIFEEYLKTLRDNGKRYEKSCRRWQVSCFASGFLLVAALIAGTAMVLTYHYRNEILSDRLEESSKDTAAALAEVHDLNERLETVASRFEAEKTELSKRLDAKMAQNDDLRGRLDNTFSQNAMMLQRFAEQSTIDKVASGETLGTPDDTSPQM